MQRRWARRSGGSWAGGVRRGTGPTPGLWGGRRGAGAGRGPGGPGAEPRRDRGRAGSARGIGLVEVLVAAGLFAALAAGVAHLFAVSARSLVQARHRTSALVFAVDKVEQLRAGGAPWGPPAAAGTVQTEFLGAGGHLLGRGGAPPAGAVYRRVTSVRGSAARPGTLVVEVRVAAGPAAGAAASGAPAPNEVVVITLLPVPEGSR